MKKTLSILSVLLCVVMLLSMCAVIAPVSSAATNLATPKFTKLETVSNGIKLTWGSVYGAAKYRIFFKSSLGKWCKMVDVKGTSYLDTDVEYGAKYIYTIRCINASGSAFTSGFNGSGWGHWFLRTPRISSATSASNGIKLQWNSVGGSQYRVYRKNGSGWQKIADTYSTSYVDTGVSKGKTYTYTVRALSPNGKQFYSYYDKTGKSCKFSGTLATPSIKRLETVANGIKMTWNAVPGAQKYRIYWKSSSGWQRIADTTGTSFIDDDVYYGYTFTYTIRCINSTGTAFMSGFNGNGWKHTYVETPIISYHECDEDGIWLAWDDVEGAEKYRVYWWDNYAHKWVAIGDTTNNVFLDDIVSYGQTYWYTVRAINASASTFTSYYDDDGYGVEYRY